MAEEREMRERDSMYSSLKDFGDMFPRGGTEELNDGGSVSMRGERLILVCVLKRITPSKMLALIIK